MADMVKPGYLVTAGASGALFGAGLYISQMVDPYKVLNFLNVGGIADGSWDPSLALVMASALVVMFIGLRIGDRQKRPIFNGKFHKPDLTEIDKPLVLGAVFFGIGWGISGICPGPGISLLAFMPENLLIFLAATFAGSFAGSYILKGMKPKPATA